jgi:hypothetical protein
MVCEFDKHKSHGCRPCDRCRDALQLDRISSQNHNHSCWHDLGHAAAYPWSPPQDPPLGICPMHDSMNLPPKPSGSTTLFCPNNAPQTPLCASKHNSDAHQHQPSLCLL